MDEPTAASPRQSGTPAIAPPGGPPDMTLPSPSPGADQRGVYPQIDGYRILGVLGSGGMGDVFRSYQLGTRREVALKLMRGSFASEKARARFDREVELTARLDHPNIARVFDSGLHQGLYYYAMELIDGLPLDQHVEQRRLDRRSVLTLLAEICRTVAHAHQRGVIHRDLKPSNILVSADGRPHVLDFGLAKALADSRPGAAGVPDAHLSIEGELSGTPAFMSPEQASGHVDSLDTRTDVYSLGVILYRLICGRFPHDSEGGVLEIMRRICDLEPVRPRRCRKDIDSELESVLLKALAREPDDRYASAGDLARDIDNYLQGEPLTARPPSTLYFLRKRVWKHRLRASVAAAVILALAGMAVISYVKVSHARDEAVRATGIAINQTALKEAARHQAELERARLLVSQGDILGREGHWNEAKEDYKNGAAIFTQEGVAPIRAGMGAWNANRAAPEPLNVFAGPRDLSGVGATSLALSADGRTALSGLRDGRVRVWDTATGRLVRTLQARAGAIWSIALSRDGRRAVSGGADGNAVVWNVATGETERTLTAPGGWVTRVAISADGRYVLTASGETEASLVSERNDTVSLWEIDGPSIPTPRPTSAPSSALKVNRRLQAVTLSAAKGLLCRESKRSFAALRMTEPGVLHADRIWLSPDVFLNSSRGVEAPPAAQFENSPSRQGEINRKAKHRFEALGRVSGAAFSPDGTSVLTFGQELALWDVARGSKVHIYHGRERAMSAAFSSDGNSILTGGADGTIEAWSKDDTDHGRTFPTHRGAVIAVGFSVGPERLIVSAAEDRTVRAWTASGEEVRSCIARDRSPADPATVSAAAFSADGRFALYCGADGTLTLWGLGQPPEAEAFAPADGPVTDISPFPGGQIVLAREPAGAAVWDLATRRKLHPTGWPAGRVEGATVSPDSRWLAAVRGERLTLWDARTLAAPRDVAVKRKAHQPAPLAFSPDGRLLLVPASGNAVAVIDADAGQELAQLRGHRDTVTCLAVSSDGRLALTGSRDKTARLWDISNPKAPREVSVLQGHADTINAVAFSPDGRGAVTAGGNSDYEAGQDDFVVRLWTITETGAATLSKSLAGHAKRVRAVALSTDGLLLASADDDGTIKLWDARTGDELRTLLGHTGPVLSLALIPGTYMLLSGSEDHSMRQWNLNAPLQRARLSVPFDAALRAMRDGAETTRPGPSSGPELLAACGLWYAWNGIDDWAADFLSRAGPSLTPDDQLTLARCYWSQGRLDDAETAFRAASGNSAETRPASGGYLQWCLESIIAEKTAGAAGSK